MREQPMMMRKAVIIHPGKDLLSLNKTMNLCYCYLRIFLGEFSDIRADVLSVRYGEFHCGNWNSAGFPRIQKNPDSRDVCL